MNWGPLDLQSNALPLSYTPNHVYTSICIPTHICVSNKLMFKHWILCYKGIPITLLMRINFAENIKIYDSQRTHLYFKF